ncbi:MAG: cytochrome c family protein [Planctomycetota bacterium]
MRSFLLGFVLFGVLLLIALSVQGGPAEEGDPTAGATYTGARSCTKCHLKQSRSWKKTKHSKAWVGLPEKYHDPAQKDDKGRACISCHTTGYGDDRGGFQDAKASKHLLGVGCESCHGPGSKHIEAGKKLVAEKRKKFNEGEPSYTILHPKTCSTCHNPHISYKAKYGEEK